MVPVEGDGVMVLGIVLSVEIGAGATVAAAIPADGDENVAEEGVVVDGGEVGEVGVGEVGGDVPLLGPSVGGEGDPGGVGLLDEAGVVVGGAVLVGDGG